MSLLLNFSAINNGVNNRLDCIEIILKSLEKSTVFISPKINGKTNNPKKKFFGLRLIFFSWIINAIVMINKIIIEIDLALCGVKGNNPKAITIMK